MLRTEVPAFAGTTGKGNLPSLAIALVVAPDKIDWNRLGQPTEAFQESSRPFRVDLLDWNVVYPAFHQVIEPGHTVVQAGQSGKIAD